jgi:hypothetical protein
MGWGAKDYLIEIARGGVEGARPDGSYGERSALAADAAHRVIWPNGVFAIPSSNGVQMTLVSTDAADDKDAGTNVRSVEIHYLDADLNEGHEEVQLEGLTPVTTIAADIRFIQCMHIQTSGANAVAAGIITAKNSGITYSQIAAADTRCASSARMVPAGKRLFVAGLSAGATSGTASAGVTVRVVASELDNHQYLDPLMLVPFGSVGLQDGSETFILPVPIPFKAGTVVAMTCKVDKDALVSGAWFGWIENAE